MYIELKNSKKAEKDLRPAAYKMITDSLILQLDNSKKSIMIDAGKGFLYAYIQHNTNIYVIAYYRDPLYLRFMISAARLIKAAADKISAAVANIAR